MTEGNAEWKAGSNVLSVAISHDGTRVVSGLGDHSIRVWDVHTGAPALEPLKGHENCINSVGICPSNNRIVSGSADCTVRIWDARTGDPIGGPLRGHTQEVSSVAFSPNSTHIVSGSMDETVRMWESNPGNPIGEPLKGHTGCVESVALSQGSSRIVSGSWDTTIRIWDVHTGSPIGQPLSGHTDIVTSVAYSYDSNRIVSGSRDGTIRIWDARTGGMIGTLDGHTDWVKSVASSLDSACIVSGSSDRSIRIWDARTGAPIGEPLKEHTNSVNSVVFSSDSSRIVSGSSDETIHVWQTPWSTLSHVMSSPSFDMITSEMSAEEIFDCLVRHGCTDLSSSIDPARFSSSPIETGGFGDVWKAWLRNGTPVAVKCLRLQKIMDGDEKGTKRMARELHHWSKARHENIHDLLGMTMFQDRLGMVSLWMDNGNLQQYIAKNPSVDRYPLCVQIAKGVAYLHGIGMVHGDIKALNVLISTEGIVKISDFDYSIISDSTLRFSATSKARGGTFRWMAPELLLPEGDDDGDGPLVTRNMQTDVYALGMTMLEIISGMVPYYHIPLEGGIIYALIKRQPPKRPQELSGPEERATSMWALLLKCWDHEPSARPLASSVLESLQRFAI